MSVRPTIIIPAHNRRAITLAGLKHLRDCGELDHFDVIVIDDGSTDGTAGAVRAEFPTVELLHGDGTLWWTGATRLGMTHAFQRGAPSVIWLNDDCFPKLGTLGKLTACLAAREADLAAPTCVDENGRVIPTGFKGRQRVTGAAGEVNLVAGLSGFCVAVHREAWRTLGPPDATRFPHYFGDTAYTLQAHRAGLRVALLDAPAVLFQHHAQPQFPEEISIADRGWQADFAAIFSSNKSVFRLATQRHYLRLKYGVIAGTGLFIIRTAGWLARWAGGRMGFGRRTRK